MQKELSKVLRDKLSVLPFVDMLAGMAQTVVTEDYNEETNVRTTKRMPVSSEVLGADCMGKEVSLVPDASRKSIIYFEDFGTTVTGRLHGHMAYSSNIRMVCWMNRANVVASIYREVSGRMIASIVDLVAGKNPENVDMFIRLSIDVARIPPQDQGLFGRYTYSEPDRQYLRPPYDFFGIDFVCKYQVPAKCIVDIDWDQQICF